MVAEGGGGWKKFLVPGSRFLVKGFRKDNILSINPKLNAGRRTGKGANLSLFGGATFLFFFFPFLYRSDKVLQNQVNRL
jgi:hypothetical protein